jgi:protocatechuate 3,4-dioxygenase beta subunit
VPSVDPAAAAEARSAVVVQPASTSDAPATPVAARTDELSGRVVDVMGQPVPAARVSLQRGDVRQYSVLDLELSRATELAGEITSDKQGEFRFVLERGIPVDLHAELAGFCEAVLPGRYAGEFVEIVLSRGYRVYGRITRERDGSPVAGAKVRVFQMGGPARLERLSESFEDGSYELVFSFRESPVLEVTPRIEQCSEWIELVLGEDGTVEKDVVVASGITVEGRVSDADTGRPIAGAIIGEGWTYRRRTESDNLGQYRLSGFGDPGVAELFARAEGYGQAKKENLPPVVGGVMHVDFELLPARRVRGRVLDAGGRPLAGVYVGAVASMLGAGGQKTDWLSSHTDDDGRFLIENLSSDLRHVLFVAKQGWSTQVYDFPPSELDQRELDLGEIVLRPPGLVCGVVQDEGGQGLANVDVTLKGWNRDRFRFHEPGAHNPLAGWYVDSRRIRTDARGRFWFGGVAAGNYVLYARQRGRPESPTFRVQIEEGELREDIVLVFPGGGTIRGQVVDTQGSGVAGLYILASLEQPRDPDAVVQDRNVSVRADADGRFEFLGLTEGEYLLKTYPYSLEEDPLEPWLPTRVEHVQTGERNLVIEMERGACIQGVLLDHTGAALFGYQIVPVSGADNASNQNTRSSDTDAEGRFSVAVPRDTTWTLEVHGSPQTGAYDRVFLTRPDVAAGTRDLVLRLEE